MRFKTRQTKSLILLHLNLLCVRLSLAVFCNPILAHAAIPTQAYSQNLAGIVDMRETKKEMKQVADPGKSLLGFLELAREVNQFRTPEDQGAFTGIQNEKLNKEFTVKHGLEMFTKMREAQRAHRIIALCDALFLDLEFLVSHFGDGLKELGVSKEQLTSFSGFLMWALNRYRYFNLANGTANTMRQRGKDGNSESDGQIMAKFHAFYSNFYKGEISSSQRFSRITRRDETVTLRDWFIIGNLFPIIYEVLVKYAGVYRSSLAKEELRLSELFLIIRPTAFRIDNRDQRKKGFKELWDNIPRATDIVGQICSGNYESIHALGMHKKIDPVRRAFDLHRFDRKVSDLKARYQKLLVRAYDKTLTQDEILEHVVPFLEEAYGDKEVAKKRIEHVLTQDAASKQYLFDELADMLASGGGLEQKLLFSKAFIQANTLKTITQISLPSSQLSDKWRYAFHMPYCAAYALRLLLLDEKLLSQLLSDSETMSDLSFKRAVSRYEGRNTYEGIREGSVVTMISSLCELGILKKKRKHGEVSRYVRGSTIEGVDDADVVKDVLRYLLAQEVQGDESHWYRTLGQRKNLVQSLFTPLEGQVKGGSEKYWRYIKKVRKAAEKRVSYLLKEKRERKIGPLGDLGESRQGIFSFVRAA